MLRLYTPLRVDIYTYIPLWLTPFHSGSPAPFIAQTFNIFIDTRMRQCASAVMAAGTSVRVPLSYIDLRLAVKVPMFRRHDVRSRSNIFYSAILS